MPEDACPQSKAGREDAVHFDWNVEHTNYTRVAIPFCRETGSCIAAQSVKDNTKKQSLQLLRYSLLARPHHGTSAAENVQCYLSGLTRTE